MYALTAHDRQPVVLFGKDYLWFVNDRGSLSLVSTSLLSRTVGDLNTALRAALND